MSSIYMYYQDIQNYLNHAYSKTHKRASMLDAVYGLYRNHHFSSQIPTEKVLTNQNFSPEHIYSTLQNFVIDVTSIIQNPTSLYGNVSEHYFMFDHRDARSMFLFQNELTPLHYHDYFEVNIVLQGQAKLTLQKESCQLQAGNLAIISPSTPHQIEVNSASIVVCLAIKKSTFEKTFASLLKDDNLLANFFSYSLYSTTHAHLIFSLKINHNIIDIIQKIFAESNSDLPYANEICCNYISILFSLTLRSLTKIDADSLRKQQLPNKIVSIINTIKNNSKTVTLSNIAQQFGYDKAYLGKLIRNHTGYSFNYLRNYYRIQHSQQLLTYTDYKIDEISSLIGYNSPNHFERCFHNLMGMSPTEYRKNNTH